MKKTLAFVLALVMLLVMGTAGATETINEGDIEAGSGTATSEGTDVIYSVDPAYTINIPGDTTVTDTTAGGGTLEVETGSRIGASETITVTLSSANYASNSFILVNGDDSLNYTIYQGATEATATTEVATSGAQVLLCTAAECAAGKSVYIKCELDAGQTPLYAGDYIGTLTFTVTVN